MTPTKNFLAGFLAYAVMFGPIAALLTTPMPVFASVLDDGASSVMVAATGANLLSSSVPAANSSSSLLGSASSVSSANTATQSNQSQSLGNADTVSDSTKSSETKQGAELASGADAVSSSTISVENAHDQLLGDATDVSHTNLCVEQKQDPLLGEPAPVGNFGPDCATGTSTPGNPTTPTTPGNNAPVITVNPITVNITAATGTYNTLTGVTATDTEDGNLTSSIVATVASVDTSVLGTTTVTFTVKDSGNLTATATRTVIVSVGGSNGGGNGGTPINNAPVITVDPITVNITQATGTYNTLTGVTATDVEDGNLTASTTASIASVDTSVLGTTTVTFTVKDSGNLTATATRTIIVAAAGNNGGGGGNNGGGNNGGGGGGGGGNGGGSTGGSSTVIGSHANPGEVLGLSTDDGECSYLNEYLRIGRTNNPAEVLKLQAFLKVYENADVTVTGNFDEKTDAAVRAFQVKYKADVLTPWGLKSSTGYVYYTTKKKINEIRCAQEFALTAEQKAEMLGYKLALANMGASYSGSIAKGDAPKADVTGGSNNTLANNSLQIGSDSPKGFFEKIKNGLFAALGLFHKGDKTAVTSTSSDSQKKDASLASSTQVVSGSVNVGASCAANGTEAKSFAQKMRSFIACPPISLDAVAAALAIVFGVIAFMMAAYLYRRTRVDEDQVDTPAMA